MDAQLKRGILEICVLKALHRQDSYGYQIIKDLAPWVTLGIHALSDPEALRRRRLCDGIHRGAQQPAPEILSSDGQGPRAHRGFSAGMGRGPSGLSLYQR